MMRYLLILFFSLSLSLSAVVLQPQDAFACSCAIGPTPVGGWTRETLTNQAEIIFRGTVVAAGPLRDYGNGVTDGTYRVLMAVDELWIGTPHPFYRVTAGIGGGDCTIPFHIGDSWLIYGWPDPADPAPDDLVSTNTCSRTAPDPTKVAGDAFTLGPGTKPTARDSLSPIGHLPLVGRTAELVWHLRSLSVASW